MKRIVGVLAAVFAAALMAVSVQAAEYSVGVSSVNSASHQATVPVSIIPDSGGENVSGYIIQIKYDPTKVDPVKNGTDDLGKDAYAVADENFEENSGSVLVSGIIENTGANENTLVVAWASATPVPVSTKTNMAEVTFQAEENATGSVNLDVIVVQATKNGTEIDSANTDVAGEDGRIDITSFLRGDANGDKAIDAQDASIVLQHIVKKATILDENMEAADANNDGVLDSQDAGLILQHIVKKATIIQ